MDTVAFLVLPSVSPSEPGDDTFVVEVKPWNGADQGEGLIFNDSEPLRKLLSQFKEAETYRVFWDAQVDSRQAFAIKTTKQEWDRVRGQVNA